MRIKPLFGKQVSLESRQESLESCQESLESRQESWNQAKIPESRR